MEAAPSNPQRAPSSDVLEGSRPARHIRAERGTASSSADEALKPPSLIGRRLRALGLPRHCPGRRPSSLEGQVMLPVDTSVIEPAVTTTVSPVVSPVSLVSIKVVSDEFTDPFVRPSNAWTVVP